MDAGLASLLGALVGGAATFAGSAYAQRAQATRDAAKGRADAADRAVIAARIVQDDLAWAEARVRQALENARYWSARYALRDDSWSRYQEALALALGSTTDWGHVQDAFRSIRTLELQAGKNRSDNPLARPPLNDFGRERAEHGLEQIRMAIEVLERLAERRPVAEVSEDE